MIYLESIGYVIDDSRELERSRSCPNMFEDEYLENGYRHIVFTSALA